ILKASSVALRQASPYFETLFSDTDLEKDPNNEEVVILPVPESQKELFTILEAMRFRVDFDNVKLTKSNVLPILDTSVAAHLQPVIDKCETWLCENLTSMVKTTNPLELYRIAYEYKLTELQTKVKTRTDWQNLDTSSLEEKGKMSRYLGSIIRSLGTPTCCT